MKSKTRKKSIAVFLFYLHICIDLLFVSNVGVAFGERCFHSGCHCRLTGHANSLSLNCANLNNVKHFTEVLNTISQNNEFFSTLQINNSSLVIFEALNELSSSFKAHIKRLILMNNDLIRFPMESLSPFTNIEEIDVSQNKLTKFSSPESISLKRLNYSKNQLSTLNLNFVAKTFPSLEVLDVSHNRIKTFANVSLQAVNFNFTINLSNNGLWVCEERLIQLINASINQLVQPFIFTCGSPWNLEGMSFTQAKSVYDTDMCRKCDCFLANEQKVMAINCTATDLKSLPQNLPVDTKIVNLTNNHIEFLTLPVTAYDWFQVRFLYLSNNSIASFQGFEGTKFLKNLALLEIQENKLEHIPKHVLEQLSVIYELYLGKNPYVCNCNTITFQEWLHKHSKQVRDISAIKCHNRSPISGIPKSELCPQPTNPIAYLNILSGTLAFLTILILVKLIYDWFWQKRTGKLPRFFKINR